MYTSQEVLEAIQNFNITLPAYRGGTYEQEWDWDEVDWWNQREGVSLALTLRGERVPVSVIAYDGGGEGHGEYVYCVIRVGDQLFRQEGYYASHYGTDWDGPFEEVEQYEKIVTAYRSV